MLNIAIGDDENNKLVSISTYPSARPIIGNLLDNAVEGCLKQANDDDRFIRVCIGMLKGQLYISVSNCVGGEIKRSGKTYVSTKNSTSTGLGLCVSANS